MTSTQNVDTQGQTLLQVMKIPRMDYNTFKGHKVILWDTASTENYVWKAHVEEMGFSGREEKMFVMTLGGDIKIIDRVIYVCKIRDLNSRVSKFKALGLESITEPMECPLTIRQLRKMFSSHSGSNHLMGKEKVDYLIGLSKASWQPQRMTQAKGGGDMWTWHNQFGVCIGGMHPWIK